MLWSERSHKNAYTTFQTQVEMVYFKADAMMGVCWPCAGQGGCGYRGMIRGSAKYISRYRSQTQPHIFYISSKETFVYLLCPGRH